ncbi:CTP-dependent riboflavin kinase [Candidatus Micrarchaeota archaeon]|nr:CTP-dependent riboflavin kinase [Candidatus Micrarchaeota archaeon]
MDQVLFLLLKQGAHLRPVRITTTEIGMELGMSQQNASKRLRDLEEEGLIKKENGLMITKKGFEKMAAVYSELKDIFERKPIEISGTIVTGLGEGKYYLSMSGYKNQIKEKLGFNAFEGTLNVKIDEKDLWKKQYVLKLEPILIPGFIDKKRTYGDLFVYKCLAFDHECALIIPLRTHHGPEIMELISPDHIRKKYHKKDGDRVRVRV